MPLWQFFHFELNWISKIDHWCGQAWQIEMVWASWARIIWCQLQKNRWNTGEEAGRYGENMLGHGFVWFWSWNIQRCVEGYDMGKISNPILAWKNKMFQNNNTNHYTQIAINYECDSLNNSFEIRDIFSSFPGFLISDVWSLNTHDEQSPVFLF